MKRSKLECDADYFRSLLAPGSHERLDMAAGTTGSAKVLLSLTGLAGSWQGEDNERHFQADVQVQLQLLTLDHQSSLSSGGPQGQLVKGDDFT